MPWRAAISPTSAAGLTSPPCVGTCVIAISFVRGPIARSSALRSSCPDTSSSTTSISIPTRLHLQEGEIVRQVIGPRRDDAVARPERNRVDRHVPGARGVFHELDLVPARADQRGDGVIDIRDALGRLARSLDAADERPRASAG